MAATDQRHALKMGTGVARLKSHTRSDILGCYKPSFMEGMARIFDFFGQLPVRRCRDSSPQATWNALHGDWEAIGADFWKATRDFETDHDLNVLGSWEMKHGKGD